jgi:autotransporter-associated beta strand protein
MGAGSGPVDMAGGRLSLETGGVIYNPFVLSAARVEVSVDQVDALGAPLVTTWAGLVSGAGMLVKTGRGELRLAGANTFSGGLTIEGGMVAVSQGAGLGRGLVRLAGGGVSLVSNVTVTNTIEVVASATRLASALNAQSQPYRATLAGSINGAGSVVKVGAGTLWATGSWAPQGGTVVQEGVLLANGQIEGGVRVEGGVLGGRGRAGAVVVGAGGTLAPGDGYGVLTMTSLRPEAGARLICSVDRADLGPGSGYAFGRVEGRLDLAALGPTARACWVLNGKLGKFDLTRDQRFELWRYDELILAPGITLPDCFELDASAWVSTLGEGFDASRLGLTHDALTKTVSLVYASPVPEPSGYGLTLAGGAGLWVFICRVRKRWAVGRRVSR